MNAADPGVLMFEIRKLSHAIGRMVRRRKGGMMWCRFDDVELKRLQDERGRLQAQLPPLRLAADEKCRGQGR